MASTASRDSQLLIVAALAARLACSWPLIYRLASTGELPVIRISSAIRIDQADLAEYLLRANEDEAS
jgi:excisionase family DNA binding protein